MPGYAKLCREAAELSDRAEVVLVLSKGKLVASHMKSGGPAPEEGEFRSMISQLETVMTTIRGNQDKFGELEFVAIHFKYIVGLLFPINEFDTLIVGILPPYHDGVISKVVSLIKNVDA